MSFLQYYILLSISGLTLLITFSLPNLFDKNFEKIGLILLYIILILSVVFNINKWNLLWMTPLAFIIPYYILKNYNKIPVNRFKFTVKYLMSLFF